MHSHVFCMRVVLCACCIVIYIVCVNCIVASYLLYIVCMLCSSSKEERLCRLLRRLNYKSINQSINPVTTIQFTDIFEFEIIFVKIDSNRTVLYTICILCNV